MSLRSCSLRRQAVLGFLLVAAIYCISPVSGGGDGYLALPSAQSLLYDRDLDLREFDDTEWFERHYAVTDVDGRAVDYFPWLSAALAVPIVAAWDAFSATGWRHTAVSWSGPTRSVVSASSAGASSLRALPSSSGS